MLTVTKIQKIKKSKNPKKGPKILEILENFRNFSKMRRIFDGESPANRRGKCELFFENTAHLGRRSDVENASHLRRIRGREFFTNAP